MSLSEGMDDVSNFRNLTRVVKDIKGRRPGICSSGDDAARDHIARAKTENNISMLPAL